MPGRSLLPQSALARQVAMLGLVLCAVALSVAFPLRNYLEQRTELAQAVVAAAGPGTAARRVAGPQGRA